jgi:aminopeptidase N
MTSLYFAEGDMDQAASQWKGSFSQSSLDYPLDNPPPGKMFGTGSYVGGALLAYELHKTMGDDAFFTGLRSYFQKYGGGVASQEQFIAEMEQAYGKPLDEVFQKWFQPIRR